MSKSLSEARRARYQKYAEIVSGAKPQATPKDTPTYCKRCGGAHAFACEPRRFGAVDWVAVMAYQIRPGTEMSLEQIGEIAGCSRERVRQIEFDALRKLAARPTVRAAVTEALRACDRF